MLVIEGEELNKSPKEIQKWFQTNLAGTVVNHPKIGEIHIYNSSFGETRNHTARKFLPILFHLKELIETSNTNGKLGKDRKNKIPNCKGFIYLYNKVKVGTELLEIRINILVDNMGQKYYMFNFVKKNKSNVLDPKMSANTDFSEGSNITLNNIIPQSKEKVNPEDKIGEIINLGDNIELKVIENNSLKTITEQLKRYLGD